MKNWVGSISNSARGAVADAAAWARGIFAQEEQDAGNTRLYWDESVSLTLSNLAHEAETRASGRVQVISLADFRTAVGELWDQYKDKILIIAESTIARMIGKGNTFIPQDEDSWLLLFPSLDEGKAEQRTDAIAAAIGTKLVGAQFTTQELPLPATAKLDLSGALNADGSINLDAVKTAISKVRQTQISRVVAQRNASTTSRAAPAPTPRRTATEQLKPLFRPAWCAETQNIDAFFFRAFNPTGVNIYGDAAPSMDDTTFLDLTKTAATAFTGMCESGLQAKMAIPIPFATLQGPALQEIKQLITSLPQRERLMRLRIEIVRIPASVTPEMLVPLREAFRAFVREIAFMVDMLAPHPQILVLDHIMLGVELSPDSTSTGDALFHEMMMFRQRAGRRGTYVLGIHNRNQLMHAVRAGFSEIGGPALHEDVRHLPLQVTHRKREELLAP